MQRRQCKRRHAMRTFNGAQNVSKSRERVLHQGTASGQHAGSIRAGMDQWSESEAAG